MNHGDDICMIKSSSIIPTFSHFSSSFSNSNNNKSQRKEEEEEKSSSNSSSTIHSLHVTSPLGFMGLKEDGLKINSGLNHLGTFDSVFYVDPDESIVNGYRF